MQSETLAFVDWAHVAVGRQGRHPPDGAGVVRQRTRSPRFYGVTGVTGDAMQQVQLDPTQRAGIVTQAVRHGGSGKADRSSPVLRGKFVREKLFCQTDLAAAAEHRHHAAARHARRLDARDVHDALAGAALQRLPHADGSDRLRLRELRRRRAVAHDRPGPARRRDGNAHGSDVERGLRRRGRRSRTSWPQSPEVRDCVATEWFRYAMGRGESTDDTCSLQSLKQSFAASQLGHQAAARRDHADDAFRYRQRGDAMSARRACASAGASCSARARPSPARRSFRGASGRRPRRPSASSSSSRRTGRSSTAGCPTGTETSFTLSPILTSLAPFQKKLLDPQRHQREVGGERTGRRPHEGHGAHAHGHRAPGRQHDGRRGHPGGVRRRHLDRPADRRRHRPEHALSVPRVRRHGPELGRLGADDLQRRQSAAPAHGGSGRRVLAHLRRLDAERRADRRSCSSGARASSTTRRASLGGLSRRALGADDKRARRAAPGLGAARSRSSCSRRPARAPRPR